MSTKLKENEQEQIKLFVECLDWMEELRSSGDAGFWEWDETDLYTKSKIFLKEKFGIELNDT